MSRARLAIAAAALVLLAIGVGFVFAGSPNRLAPGTQIAGVDVGGMSVSQARSALAQKAAALANSPVTFVAGTHTWQIRPRELGVTVDWASAVSEARADADGFGFLRGYRRLALRLFPTSIEPTPHAFEGALTYELGLLSADVDRAHVDAHLERHGLTVDVVHGETGLKLQTDAASPLIVNALGSFDRLPVRLPVAVEPPKVTVPDLARAQRLAQRVLSAPVTLTIEDTKRTLTPTQLASMLLLEQDGATKLQLGGPAANRYFARLDRLVSRPPKDADFEMTVEGTSIIPAKPGLALDVPETVARVLAAAERPVNRLAEIAVGTSEPKRTTAAARAMGITGRVATYETIYGGIPNRIHNVQLVAHLVDHKFIAPGATFSFNAATGARTAAQGFLEAPVIINGEVETGLGGGVCQVSTTVFNAAYEAGLPIVERTNHALYISHYPLGRDATVDYPNVDMKFVNNTGHWLLLRTIVGPTSLVVILFGTPQHRRVETDAQPLKVVGAPHVKKTLDKSLPPGTTVVDDPGVPAESTSVRRRVYAPDGTLMSDASWYSYYRSSPKLVRVGPKKKPVAATATSLAAPH